MISRIQNDVQSLADIKSRFGGENTNRKIELIRLLSKSKIKRAKLLQSYHESLCYLRAYPDSRELLRVVEDQLRIFFNRISKIPRPERSKLNDSGIVGTELRHFYGLFMTKWLMMEFPGAVDIDWKEYQGNKEDHILDLLPVLLSYAENDAVDDPYISVLEILEAGASTSKINKLEWFTRLFERLPADLFLKRLIYDKIELPLVIRVKNYKFARTHASMQIDSIYYQQEALSKEYPNLRKIVTGPKLKPRLLRRSEARSVVDTHKMAMIMRHRELWPLTFANLDEVYATDVGRGMTIYIMGMHPVWRLPIESNYAALLVRNGIPIGYGIGAMAFERIEIAINVFETFRGNEAGFLFGQFTKLYHQLFGCNYLLIRKYQVGWENSEGLKSGAYWFYYKLGFRTIDPELRQLVEDEAAKIARHKSYRTPKEILKRLAESDLCLDLARPGVYKESDVPLGKLALAQTALIAREFSGDRNLAESEAPRRAQRLLGIRSVRNWSQSEKLWFRRMSLLVLVLPGVEKWSRHDKSALADILRAKGALREVDYTQMLRKHKQLIKAIEEVTR